MPNLKSSEQLSMSDNDAANLQENKQETEPEVTMESLMGEFDAEGMSLDIPTAGEIRDGIIASLSDNRILVSIGAKSEGIIEGKEFDAIPKEILAVLDEAKYSVDRLSEIVKIYKVAK